jgi:mannose-6-phosphate isomerase-like protein (cupin superfamily)
MAQIFISFASEDGYAADALRGFIQQSLVGASIFLASDPASIPPGDEWLKSLRNALREAKVLVVLLSTASLENRWINLEVGAAWVQSIPIIPILLDGLNPNDVPRPLADWQISGIDSPANLYSFLAALNSKLPKPLIKHPGSVIDEACKTLLSMKRDQKPTSVKEQRKSRVREWLSEYSDAQREVVIWLGDRKEAEETAVNNLNRFHPHAVREAFTIGDGQGLIHIEHREDSVLSPGDSRFASINSEFREALAEVLLEKK